MWFAAAGALLSAYQAYDAGQKQDRLDRWNAQVADLQAAQTNAQGVRDASARTVQGGQLAGAQKAALAAQGIDVNEQGGTAEALLADTNRTTEQDATTIRANATRQAWGFQIDATNSRMAGSLAKSQGNQRAAGNLLQGAGTFYKDGYDAQYWGGSSKKLTVPTTASAGASGNVNAKF